MPLGTIRQDTYTTKEFAEHVLPNLDKGKYTLNVGGDGTMKVCRTTDRWIQRDEVPGIE